MKELFTGIASSLIAALILTLLVKFTNFFTRYQVVVVDKKQWQAFKRLVPSIAAKLTKPEK